MPLSKVILFLITATASMASVANARSEREILEAFYESTEGPRWKISDGWMDDNIGICEWYGIECAASLADSGIGVEKIILNDNSLIGAATTLLFELPFLKELDLSNNFLTEFSFENIQLAASLKVLDLTNNGITSLEGISFAPKELSTIRLADNQIKGPITEEITKLQFVKRLLLSHNYLSGSIPASISDMISLEVLQLDTNTLSGMIPPEIGDLINLRKLFLGDNYFSGSIPSEIEQLTELKLLSIPRITRNQEEGKIHVLNGRLPAFSTMKSLTDLELAGNSITGNIPSRLLKETEVGGEKIVINLHDNEMTGTIPAQFGERFEQLFIDLTGNYIEEIPSRLCEKSQWMGGDVGVFGCDAILCPLGTANFEGRQTTANSTCVPCIDLVGATYLGHTECFKEKPIEAELSERDILNLLYDALDGENWSQNTNWKDTTVDVCDWYGIICVSDSDEMEEHDIEKAIIENMNLDGRIIGIALSSNRLFGPIPEEIFLLSGLVFIDVGRNSVNFPFRGLSKSSVVYLTLTNTDILSLEGISNARFLRNLKADRNDMTGTIPSEIFEITSLHRLDLSFNFLSGSLPSNIAQLSELRRLRLYGNELTSTIPSEIGLLSRLVILDIAENDFTGHLPNELNNLEKLNELSLHQTNRDGQGLDGPLLDFSNLKFISNLALDSNEFTGTIPESFLSGVLSKEEEITVGLSWNNIAGTVPASLDTFKLMNIDLVGNFITGIAPELCDNDGWMDGMVGEFNCDAIMCPTGTFNADGLVWNRDDLCRDCESAKVYGSVHCEALVQPKVTTERDILESLFYATGGRTWSVETNWTVPWIPICSWEGISCISDFADADLGVEVIDLQNFGLGGSIPPEIFELPSLKHLNLRDNEVDFSFDSIANASLLETLILEGTGIASIDGIQNAVSIKELDLSRNLLSGKLPTHLFALTSLSILNIAYNGFTGDFPDEIGNLINIEHLNCFGNKFSGELPRSLESLSKLKVLNFGENRFIGPIPLIVHNMLNLEIIDFSAQTSEDGISGELLDFSNFLNLRSLNLASNSLAGTIPFTFLDDSILIDELVSIDLSYNELSGTIPKSLGKFNKLSINLIENHIVGIPFELCDAAHGDWMGGTVQIYECDAILCPKGTANLYGMRNSIEAECTRCEFGMTAPYMGMTQCLSAPQVQMGTEVEILIDFYKQTGGLTWKKQTNWLNLDVEMCDWYGVVCGDNGIEEIRLPNNNLDGSVSSLFQLPHLKVLDLSINSFLDVSFSGLENATNLEILVLAGTNMNSLEGISLGKGLTEVNVAGNLISGTIPDEIYDMVNLHRLFLSYNDFEGTLSSRIGKLDKLRWFFMSENRVGGPLPTEIGELWKLIRLDLSGNKFTGSLPSSMLNLIKLESLSLNNQKSDNGFSGPLLDFGVSEFLSSLSLEDNSLTGTIPTTLLANSRVKSDLVMINLSSNSLSGSIPTELGEFTMLNIDLVGNQFNYLPPSLCDSNSGNSLWMNGNVGLYQCSAILCPAGQYSKTGRQDELATPCLPCPSLLTSPLIGSTQCIKQGENTVHDESDAENAVNIGEEKSMTEKEILMKLFVENGGQEWNVSTNWNEDSIGICMWYGILCSPDRSNDDEGVLSIELSNDDSGNNLVGFIPTQIFDLPSLQVLNLKGNQIDIDFTSISDNASVEVLYLSNTKITTIDGINSITGVKELHLTDTGAHGNIDSIFEMKLLTDVYLSYNHLTGSLSRIGEVRNLVRFFAINNEITGYIPPSIGALTHLNTMAVSGNFITGTIPDSMNGLANLEAFANLNDPARGPGLTGDLLDFSGTKLRQLVLNHNSLTGTIPSSFLQGTDENADGMMIWLSFNYLSGAVPSELDRFKNVDLLLEGNQLTSLPEVFCDDDNINWMRGSVENFGCDAILCPAGTFNPSGRQKHADEPCLPCNESGIVLGRVSCDVFSERYFLKQLYLSTGGQTWDNNENWTSDEGICNWYGITCDESSPDNDSLVTTINLEGNALVGVVSAEIFRLPHLETLNLKSNVIDLSFSNTPFPKSLIELELSDTGISSLEGIGVARSLQRLHLGAIGLKGSIPEELFELDSLVELYLSYNELSGTLSSKIGDLRELRFFTLFDNHISGTLPSELGQLTELKELVLSKNYFTGTIPTEIESLINIVSLSIFGHNGVGVGLSGKLPAFSQFPYIKELILDYNSLSGTIPLTFLDATDKNDDIEIGLSYNHLTGQLPVTLDRFFSLDIALVGNMIMEVPEEFCDNKNWMGGTVEKFSCDAILCPKGTSNDSGRQSLDRNPCVKCQEPLSTLYTGSTRCVLSERGILNKLYEQCNGGNWKNRENWGDENVDICQWDGVSCSTSGHVSALLLGSNNLNGILPKEIFDLPDLQTLWLYSNPIQFSFDGIENVRKLESLLLDSTGVRYLDGIEDATHLRELGLRFNQMTGFLPTQLANLKSLESLSLSENSFSGMLPSYLETLTNLKKLRIGSNMLSGQLLEFKNMPNLYSLDLSDNQLTGTIPQSFLSSVPSDTSIVVDLSTNMIGGEIPANLGRLRELTLYIRDNQIDNIPSQLCKQRDWNDGGVSEFGCEAIACPPGTFNEHGRMKSNKNPCVQCGSAMFYGSVSCSDIISDDVVNNDTSSAAKQISFYILPLLLASSYFAFI